MRWSLVVVAAWALSGCREGGRSSSVRLVADLDTRLDGVHLAKVGQAGDDLYFTAHDADGDAIWRTDGTVAGTALFERFDDGIILDGASGFASMEGSLVFVGPSQSGDDAVYAYTGATFL